MSKWTQLLVALFLTAGSGADAAAPKFQVGNKSMSQKTIIRNVTAVYGKQYKNFQLTQQGGKVLVSGQGPLSPFDRLNVEVGGPGKAGVGKPIQVAGYE